MEVESKETELSKEQKRESLMILKNIFMISFSFLLLFTAFLSMANMQSTINPEIGAYSLAIIYIAMVVSSVFLPSFLMKKCKCKWTMCLGMITYSVYMAAQSYPVAWILITTAIIIGFGASPLWAAQSSYFSQVGNKYANLTGKPKAEVISKFFSFLFAFFQMSNIIGGIVASLTLSVDREYVELDSEDLLKCGANFCPVENPSAGNISLAEDVNSNLAVSDLQRWIMAGVFTGFSLLAALVVAVGVDPLERFIDTSSGKNSDLSGIQLMAATLRQSLRPQQICLIPITFWNGYQQAFIGADYTAAFVGCSLGVSMIGYVLVTYGAVDAVFANLFSFTIKKVGRPPIMIVAAIVHCGALTGMLLWQPDPSQSWLFFFLAVLWAIGDSVWLAQVSAFYGAVFVEDSEAAFSAYQLWQSSGFIAGYFAHKLICMNHKIYSMFGLLALSMIGYAAVELMQRKRVHPKKTDDDKT